MWKILTDVMTTSRSDDIQPFHTGSLELVINWLIRLPNRLNKLFDSLYNY